MIGDRDASPGLGRAAGSTAAGLSKVGVTFVATSPYAIGSSSKRSSAERMAASPPAVSVSGVLSYVNASKSRQANERMP